MFHDLDEALRQLLIRDVPVKNGEIEIAFNQPKREWSARLSKPTINLFLHDVRENFKLRHSQEWDKQPGPDNTMILRRQPVRVDIHYIITTWANEPEDEHNLLARALSALLKYRVIPQEFLPESLKGQELPIQLSVAQGSENIRHPADIWSVLDNEMRPTITLLTTITVDPYEPIITPVASTLEVRAGQVAAPKKTPELTTTSRPEVLWTVGGSLETDKPLDKLSLILLERGLDVSIEADGQFAISRLRPGEYTLEVKIEGEKAQRHTIVVPSPDYIIKV
jgi:hypothetical protein